MYISNYSGLTRMLMRRPSAVATVRGGEEYGQIFGSVKFYQAGDGVVVLAEIMGLPATSGDCDSAVFGFHIHGGGSCTGNDADEFADVGTHYDPADCPHPYHAGDMPPLFSAGGAAILAFVSNRFKVDEIIGRTVIIHDKPDDFTTQPSGNAGKKIACGEIVRVK